MFVGGDFFYCFHVNNAVGFVIVLSKIKCHNNKKKKPRIRREKKVLLFSKEETSDGVLMQLKPLILPAALHLCVCGDTESRTESLNWLNCLHLIT